MLLFIPWYYLVLGSFLLLYIFIKVRIVFFIYLILGILYFSLIWGEITIYDLLYPRRDVSMAFAWNVMFMIIDMIFFFFSVAITFAVDAFIKRKTDKKTFFSMVWKRLPSFKTLFSIIWKTAFLLWILLQPYLIWSGYQAYHEAKKLDVKNFSEMGVFDFYSPFVKYIRVDLKNVENKPYTDTFKRWSYRRGKFVYQYQ